MYMHSLAQTGKHMLHITASAKLLLWRITAHDALCVAFLILVALMLRVPFITYPNVTEYDEVTYANYAMHMVDGKPFVDIHPPLARILFAEVARKSEPIATRALDMTFNRPYGDFPIANERLLIALFGILLPLIFYAITRTLGSLPRVALLVGLFVATDNGMIIFSRVMLPDMLLLCFSFLALLCILMFVRTKKNSLGLLIGAGVTIGLALSVKWTALGMLMVLLFTLLIHKRIGAALVVGTLACFVYIVVFASMLLVYFPFGGHASNFANEADRTKIWTADIDLPRVTKMGDAISYLPTLHKVMFTANTNPDFINSTLKSQGAYSWPIARNAMIFWKDSTSAKSIVMTGNSTLWVMSFFALIFDLLWIMFMLRRTKKIPVDTDELVLLFGYFANYIPFFFIHRPMYLYHYFIAMLLLLLLLPKIAPRIVHCLAITTNDKLFAQVFIVFATILVFVNFIMTLQTTYGF